VVGAVLKRAMMLLSPAYPAVLVAGAVLVNVLVHPVVRAFRGKVITVVHHSKVAHFGSIGVVLVAVLARWAY
jgi:hypothetical protein